MNKVLSRLFSTSTSTSISDVSHAQVEKLEDRVLLSAVDTGYESEQVAMEWQGQQVNAVKNSWIVSAEEDSYTHRWLDKLSNTYENKKIWGTGSGYVSVSHLYDANYEIVTEKDLSANQIKRYFGSFLGFDFYQPNFIYEYSADPNDTRFSDQWALNNTGQSGGISDVDIDASEAWDIHTGGGDVIVAVLDSGVNYNHVDLDDNMWVNTGEINGDGIDNDGNGFVDDYYGYDFGNNTSDPMDLLGHGTHVAGIIGAEGDNATGVSGVNQNVKLMALQVGDSAPTASAVANALNYVNSMSATHNIRVANLSLSLGSTPDSLVNSAITALQISDVLVVVSSGNNGSNIDFTPVYPASHSQANVITVASTDHNDQRAGSSNYGSTSVDLAAPGVNILSTYGSGYDYLSGTSMAAPHVAGALSLLLSYNPTLTGQEAKQLLLDTVDEIPSLNGLVATGGRLNVHSLLQAGTISSDFAYSGQPHVIESGSRLEAEDFDTGGAGVSYSDTSAGNQGNRTNYRTTDVDLFYSTDDSGGTVVGNTTSNEYLEYSVDVTGGLYNITLRTVAGFSTAGGLKLLSGDGATFTELGTFDVTATNWQDWVDVTLNGIQLDEGTQVLRLEVIDGGGFNINYLDFESAAYGGQPHVIESGSRLEAEDFDTGGAGVSYSDTSAGNQGNRTNYRTTDVDLFYSTDDSGGTVVGNTTSNEYLEYSVDVTGGLYNITLRTVAGFSTAGGLKLLSGDGATFTELGTFDVTATNWQDWVDVTLNGIQLDEGTQVLRLEVIDGGGFNINYLDFESAAYGGQPHVIESGSRLEAEDFDTGGAGVSYSDTSAGNQGNRTNYRTTDVDLFYSTDDSGGTVVGNTTSNEYLEYSVDVTGGLYNITLRTVAGFSTAGGLKLLSGDGATFTELGTFDVTATNWQDWVDVTLNGIQLDEGTQVLRLEVIDGGGFNINYLDFESAAYGGQPHVIESGSRLEAEDFDTGGAGVSYSDTSAGNQGNRTNYRTTDVDLFYSTDDSGGTVVGNTTSNEYLEYSVDVTGGLYNITLRTVAGFSTAGGLKLLSGDGATFTELGTFDVTATNWQDWVDVTLNGIQLDEGTQVLRLEVIDGGGFNINYLDFVAV